jgi:hypothetical protein
MVEIATPHKFHDLWVYKVTFRVTDLTYAPSLIQGRYTPSLGREFVEFCTSRDLLASLCNKHAAYAEFVSIEEVSICIGEFRDW